METKQFEHQPVQVAEALDFLAPERGGVFVDATIGLGGHAQAILERGGARVELVGIDRDPEALELAAKRLEPWKERVRLVLAPFDELASRLDALGVGQVAGIFADLGVSSLQLDRAARGFSFRHDGPLDMRMGEGATMSARDVVNNYSEVDLEQVLREYGEERRARRVARAIVRVRSAEPIETTAQLQRVVHGAIGPRSGGRHGMGGIDSATRTFQALRIEVNQELRGLEAMLDQAIGRLESDGRLVVISYHSLEDRIVKETFRQTAIGEVDPVTGRRRSETRLIELLTKKPIRPTTQEVAANPRSRSARLRAARRW
jgi:16S rRNA (cytosine1402-N4)-methyltransferase